MKIERISQSALPDDQQHPVTDIPSMSYGMPNRQESAQQYSALLQPVRPNPTLIRFPNHTFYNTSLPVTAVSQTILSFNPTRRYLLIQNVGINDLVLGFNIPATLADGVQLPSGFQIVWENGIVPNNAIQAFSSTGTTVVILEGVEA